MKLPSSFTTVTPFSKILALFLFILLPIGGFFLGMWYQRIIFINDLQFLQELRQLTPTVSPTPVDETVNWKTYRNAENGFEFKYPEYFELRASEQNYGNDMYLHVSITDIQYEPKTPLAPSFIDIKEPVKLENQSFEEYIDTNFPPGRTIHGQEGQEILPKEEIFIDNRYKSYRVSSCSMLCDETIFLNSGDKVVVISTLSFNELDDNYIKNTILKIFSTFRFLDEIDEANITTQKVCIENGGVWQVWGLSSRESCQIPTTDAGASCTDATDCVSNYCVSEDGKLPGTCSKYKQVYGCIDLVKNNKVQPTLCFD